MISQNLIKTKKPGKGANKAGQNKGKKLGDPRQKTRPKALKRRAVAVKPKPRLTLMVPRTRRTPARRKTIINHVGQ